MNNNFSYGQSLVAKGKGHDNYSEPGKSAAEAGAGVEESGDQTGKNLHETKISPRQVYPEGYQRKEPTLVPPTGPSEGVPADGNNMQERRADVYEGARTVDNFPDAGAGRFEGMNVSPDGMKDDKVLPHESEIVEKTFHRVPIDNLQPNPTSAGYISRSSFPMADKMPIDSYKAEEKSDDVDNQADREEGEFESSEKRVKKM